MIINTQRKYKNKYIIVNDDYNDDPAKNCIELKGEFKFEVTIF